MEEIKSVDELKNLPRGSEISKENIKALGLNYLTISCGYHIYGLNKDRFMLDSNDNNFKFIMSYEFKS